jgi:hypothetical protein
MGAALMGGFIGSAIVPSKTRSKITELMALSPELTLSSTKVGSLRSPCYGHAEGKELVEAAVDVPRSRLPQFNLGFF